LPLQYTFASGAVAGAIRDPATEKETYGALKAYSLRCAEASSFRNNSLRVIFSRLFDAKTGGFLLFARLITAI
jgi:hypothetical protein